MIQEIEYINYTDEKIRMHLAHKEKTSEILKMNKIQIDKSLSNMLQYFSNNNNNNKGRNLLPSVRNNNVKRATG